MLSILDFYADFVHPGQSSNLHPLRQMNLEEPPASVTPQGVALPDTQARERSHLDDVRAS